MQCIVFPCTLPNFSIYYNINKDLEQLLTIDLVNFFQPKPFNHIGSLDIYYCFLNAILYNFALLDHYGIDIGQVVYFLLNCNFA